MQRAKRAADGVDYTLAGGVDDRLSQILEFQGEGVVNKIFGEGQIILHLRM